jgi:ADP-ribose pyrophosphatase
MKGTKEVTKESAPFFFVSSSVPFVPLWWIPIAPEVEHMADSTPERRLIFRGKKVDLALQTVSLADGSTAEREVVLHRGAVALLTMVDADHICLVRNRRYAVDRTLLEVPAGTLDPGESPDATAARELREETGYVAGRMTRIAEWWVSPGVLSERMYLYLCEDLTPGLTEHQPDEHLEPQVVPWDEALTMVHDGRIDDAKSMLAILLGERRRVAARAGLHAELHQ